MAMRLSGLMSGMDTESLVAQLVEARRVKVDDAIRAQTKLTYKQEAWTELNKKIKNLQSKHVNVMRYTTAYSKKTTVVSNSNALSVITGENAVNGVQSLQVKQLAKTGYLTGGQISGKDDTDLTALSKLSDITDSITGEGSITLNVNGENKEIKITAETTISDILTQMKNAGINASFDANNQRFFISAKASGAKNDFSLTADNEIGKAALQALGLEASLKDDKATLASYQKWASYYTGDYDSTVAAMDNLITKDVQARVDTYLAEYQTIQNSIAEMEKKLDDDTLTDEDKQAIQDEIAKLQEKLNAVLQKIEVTETEVDGEKTYTAVAKEELTKEVKDTYHDRAKYASELLESYAANPNAFNTGAATKISGQDAIITLNGAEFTGEDNVFEINGLTFTALNVTKEGEEITVTTKDDTEGLYNVIKNFLKDYNELINEIDKLYNAASAKGYEPMLDEEKASVSEAEAEKYEKKIRDAILRRDENLNTVGSTLRSVMSATYTIDGEELSLFNFGIENLGYFESPDNEKNAYHIAGDADDEYTSGKEDKLKTLISNDPEKVINFFTNLAREMSTKMDGMSKSVDGYRSYGNFYDDKKLKSDVTDYASKIKDLEKKLAEYEDKWYQKFAKMETAMAKMQGNVNAVTSLIGGGM